MESSGLKTMAVAGIILGCFATFFPRVISPLFMALVSRNKNEPLQGDGYARRHEEPSHKYANPGLDFHHKKQLGVHPGMHAASEMRRYTEGRQKTAPSAGNNILTVVLPLYAVGIVIYLIYTLTKLFSKKKKSDIDINKGCTDEDVRSGGRSGGKGVRRGYVDVDEGRMMKEQVVRKQKQLEKLLLKAEHDSIDDDEMLLLRQRLSETERQMGRILTALEGIQLNFNQSSQSIVNQMSTSQPCTDHVRAYADVNEHDNITEDDEDDEDEDEDEEEEDGHVDGDQYILNEISVKNNEMPTVINRNKNEFVVIGGDNDNDDNLIFNNDSTNIRSLNDDDEENNENDGGKCDNENFDKCIDEPREKCIDGPREECIDEPREECIDGPREECIDGPREECIEDGEKLEARVRRRKTAYQRSHHI